MKKNIETQKKRYIAPDIDVVEIQIEQNILLSGSGGPSSLPGMPGSDW